MAITYTSNVAFEKPAKSDRYWNTSAEQWIDVLDVMPSVGGLMVSSLERPSTSLYINISSGPFRFSSGVAGEFSGSTSVSVPNNQTVVVYLDGAGNPSYGSAYPSTAHIRLATVTAAGGVITSVVDNRVVHGMLGTDATPYLPLSGGTLEEGADIATGTTMGTKLGTSSSQKLGFWGASPVVRPTAYSQVYTTSDRTLSSYSSNIQSSSYSGIDNAQTGSVYATLADLNSLRVAYENLRAFSEDLAQLVNSILDDLQSMGLLQ